MEWKRVIRSDGRIEWLCEHGVGHGNHIHGCDGCCSREDFPLRKEKQAVNRKQTIGSSAVAIKVASTGSEAAMVSNWQQA